MPHTRRHTPPLRCEAQGDPEYTLISTGLLAELLECPKAASGTPSLPPLHNRYFALRHGQSEANVEGVISSLPSVGTTKHGLTPLGRIQARRAATSLIDAVGREHLDNLYFYASDFTRAWQTAEETLAGVANLMQFENALLCDVDGCRQDDAAASEVPKCLSRGVKRTELLRERWFGELDGTKLVNYNKVWPRDLVSAKHTNCGVESVESVATRVREFVLETEARHKGCSIVLVSHADTLQISQCYVAGVDCRTFSQYRFQNAEVRKLEQTAESLPKPIPLSYL
ncbi:hypothetical protein AB1Y20_003844 [Prymnesium parvum]|uniref:Phosphoglycerate mutase n=1 Tax=Prymnesium parvum TaxID=97485 RepID=A0AB34J811_PRYPA